MTNVEGQENSVERQVSFFDRQKINFEGKDNCHERR